MELSVAFVETIRHDKNKIIRDFIKEDLQSLFSNIGVSTISLAKSPHVALKKIRDIGIKGTYSSIKERIFAFGVEAKGAPKRYKEAMHIFFAQIKQELASKKSGQDKSAYILAVLSYFTSFLVGIHLGRAIPDQDIRYLGIGKHRSIFTHSVVPLICVKILAKFMFRVVDAVYVRVGDNDRGKSALALVRNNLRAMAGGMAVGVATHLFQDGVFEPSGTIRGPGFNTFISGTTLDDQAFLVVNSFFSCLLSKTFISPTTSSQKLPTTSEKNVA